MGLASSQARLLNLTTRMHQIEYKAAKLEAEKLQMANESSKAYDTYLEALEKTKVQYKVLTSDGSISYQDINTYDDFLAAGHAVNFRGTVYDGSKGFVANGETFSTVGTITPTDEEVAAGGKYNGLTANQQYYVYSNGKNEYYSTAEITGAGNKDLLTGSPAAAIVVPVDKTVTLNYAQLCADAFNADPANPPANVYEVITNLINSGDVTLVAARKDYTFAVETDSDYNFFQNSVSTNTNLREVTDEKYLKKAEAEYEANMKKIDMKDRRFDSELAAIEAERNAIKQEMETLKTVAKDNVERTFKLFS